MVAGYLYGCLIFGLRLLWVWLNECLAWLLLFGNCRFGFVCGYVGLQLLFCWFEFDCWLFADFAVAFGCLYGGVCLKLFMCLLFILVLCFRDLWFVFWLLRAVVFVVIALVSFFECGACVRITLLLLCCLFVDGMF